MAGHGEQRDRGGEYWEYGGDRGYERGPRRGPPTSALTVMNRGTMLISFLVHVDIPARGRLRLQTLDVGDPCHHADTTTSTRKRSASSDSLHLKVAEIDKSVAAVCQYVEVEQQKKAVKERRKAEKDAEERAMAEQGELALKKEEEEKVRKAMERLEEMNKNVDIRFVVRIGELREDVRDHMRHEICEAFSELCAAMAKGKQEVAYQQEVGSESSASSSENEELGARTRNLSISEKPKHGPEPVFEVSPPMELPAKRTLQGAVEPVKLTTGLTRSRARGKTKTPIPKKTPLLIRKKIPASIGAGGGLKLERQVMHDLKNLDALVLQNICKDEGIAYNGKFKVIFDIAAHRTRVAYGSDVETDEDPSQGGNTVEIASGEEGKQEGG
ncbi:hypothetical protein CBR_g47938 [Chara braunii]|uniref:Uncharacterized protein n=1 Tax=Chara braunii TaxID=69332 RepID=A0A388M1K6_CHABU|nr:hypothetical protein CBR_g47938 [Chara braunii]|eukprot:GBG88468.1 hypothetical protein CBR_g47938 [Chara braunii]